MRINSANPDAKHNYNSASDFDAAPTRVRILIKDAEKTIGEKLVAKFKRVAHGGHMQEEKTMEECEVPRVTSPHFHAIKQAATKQMSPRREVGGTQETGLKRSLTRLLQQARRENSASSLSTVETEKRPEFTTHRPLFIDINAKSHYNSEISESPAASTIYNHVEVLGLPTYRSGQEVFNMHMDEDDGTDTSSEGSFSQRKTEVAVIA